MLNENHETKVSGVASTALLNRDPKETPALRRSIQNVETQQHQAHPHPKPCNPCSIEGGS